MSRRAAQRRRSRIVFAASLLGSLLGVALLAWCGRTDGARPAASGIEDARPAAPAPRGAGAVGGRPAGAEPALRSIFERRLAELAVALDRRARLAPGQSAASIDRALTELEVELRAAPRVGAELAALVTAGRALASEGDRPPEERALGRAVAALDLALAAADLPYYVTLEVTDTDESGARALLFGFEVERITFYRAGAASVRALRLRRIDNLSIVYTLFGYTARHLPDALVLVESFDSLLAELLPAMAGRPSGMLAPRSPPPSWRAAFDARFGEIAAVELGGPTMARRDLGQLGAERAAVLSAAAARLADGTVELRPSAIPLDQPPPADVLAVLSSAEAERLTAVAAGLGAQASALAALREQLIAAVERHEVQHRLDALGPALPTPAPLAALIGGGDLLERAREEASAYLAGLARDGERARLALGLMMGFALEPSRVGSAESYVAVVVLDQLGQRLGLPPARLIVDRAIDEAAVVTRYLALTERPSAELAAAAGALWSDWFARPLPALTAAPPGSHGAPNRAQTPPASASQAR